MKPVTRFISALLTFCMVISLMPQTILFAHAVEDTASTAEQTVLEVVTEPISAEPAFEEFPSPTASLDEPVTTAATEEFTYTANGSGEATITGYTGSESVVKVPHSIDGHPVVAIGNGSFKGISALKEIEIPVSVTSIEDSVFNGCIALEKVELANGLTFLGERVFKDCVSLTEITIPNSLENCGYNQYYNSYDNGIFYGCSNLKRTALKPHGVIG
jgi:hypothetical protein